MRRARGLKRTEPEAPIKSRALGALKLASEARNENVPAKRASFFFNSFIGFLFLGSRAGQWASTRVEPGIGRGFPTRIKS